MNYIEYIQVSTVLSMYSYVFLHIHFMIRVYFSRWVNKLLSEVGRVTLIWSVLSAIPLHLFAVYRLPFIVIPGLERKLSYFYWGHHYHWRTWIEICLPTEEEGDGIRSLTVLQQFYKCKMWWSYQNFPWFGLVLCVISMVIVGIIESFFITPLIGSVFVELMTFVRAECRREGTAFFGVCIQMGNFLWRARMRSVRCRG